MEVCVTGGLGFIGVPVCALLADRGHEVRCVDRLSGRYDRLRGAPAAAALSELPGVRVIRADVGRDPLEPLVGEANAIIHLAALPGVRSRHGARHLWRENALTTQRLVAASRRWGQRFLLASSSSVYGDACALPTPERARRSPLGPYGSSKLAAEDACFDAARRGTDAVIVRPFTVFGPGQRPDMAFARWIEAISSGAPVVWCARPGARREFTYVDDAARGIVAALERGRTGEAYNLAGTGSTPVSEALGQIEEVLGARARLRRRAPWPGEALATAACGEKAARELGYRPAVSLREGLERQVGLGLEAPADELGHAGEALAQLAETAGRQGL